MPSSSDAQATPEVKARIAVIFVDEQSLATLRDCFKQFDMECMVMDSIEQLSRQKIEGCVIGLDHDHAGDVLEHIRKSPSNMRAVLYGIEKRDKVAVQYLRYGISVVLHSPVDRIAVIKAIRSTRALLLNEFRRYVRIPLAVEVTFDIGGSMFSSYTEEMSGGGFSFHVPQMMAMPTGTLYAAFTLPGGGRIQTNVTVCWSTESERMIGVRFDPTNPNRELVRKWVDDYLKLS